MLLNPTDRYLLKKGQREGMREGMREGKLEVALKLIEKGYTIDFVVDLTGLSKKDILSNT